MNMLNSSFIIEERKGVINIGFFVSTERDGGFMSDNLLNYHAGPIEISISGSERTITCSTSLQ